MSTERTPFRIAEDLRAAARKIALVDVALVEIAVSGHAAVAARELLGEQVDTLMALANEVSPPYAGDARPTIEPG